MSKIYARYKNDMIIYLVFCTDRSKESSDVAYIIRNIDELSEKTISQYLEIKHKRTHTRGSLIVSEYLIVMSFSTGHARNNRSLVSDQMQVINEIGALFSTKIGNFTQRGRNFVHIGHDFEVNEIKDIIEDGQFYLVGIPMKDIGITYKGD